MAGFPVCAAELHRLLLHIYGPAGAVPILFLHGAGAGVWSWKPQREALERSFRLFLWEAQGHEIAEYYADAREALAAVVDDGHRPAFLVGHSAGALLAMALGCDVAAAVAGLFLIDPVYPSASEFVSRAWLPTEQLRRAFGAPKGFPLREFANEITDPTFLLESSAGRRSRFPRLVATLRERLGEDFTYETIPGGHYLQLDHSDVVNDRLKRFVETYAGEPRERTS